MLAASVQLVGWCWNARRQAVGVDGPLWFLPAAEWSPPLGSWPWLVLAAGACTLLALSGFAAAQLATRGSRGYAPVRAGRPRR